MKKRLNQDFQDYQTIIKAHIQRLHQVSVIPISRIYRICIAVILAFTITLTFIACGEHSWDQTSFADGGTYNESEPKAIVGPLLKTQWGSGSPYNPFHTLSDGSSGWVDCGTLATSQIMNYHKYPSQAIAGAPYQGIVFDWDNMLDSYKNVNLTESQKKAINDLEHSMHLALQTGAGRDFVTNFGYDKGRETHYHKYHSDSAWVAIIKEQLDLGLPVQHFGTDSTISSEERAQRGISGGHVIVIDGYDSRDRFHINWGWGGSRDGYYLIDSLNPGHSQYPSGFSYDSRIQINVQPDKGSIGTNAMALDSFAVGKTSISQYELFNIKARIHRFGYFPGGQLGTALVDNKGNIVKVLGIRSSVTSYNMDVFVPEDVHPGQYTLRIVSRFEGGEWEIAKLSDRTAKIPSAINFTVNSNKESGAPGGGYGLALTKFTTDNNSVNVGETFKVSMKFKNMNEEKYTGGLYGVALVDDEGEIVEVIRTYTSTYEYGSGSTNTLNDLSCKVPDTVPPGQYRLRIVIMPKGKDEWHVATMSLENSPTAIDFTVK